MIAQNPPHALGSGSVRHVSKRRTVFLSDRKAVAMICFFVLFCFVLFVCLFEFFSKHFSVLFISLNRQRFPYCFLTSSPLAYTGSSSLCSFSW